MVPVSLLQGLGGIGFFSTRIFLPALISALLIRFGAEIPWIRDSGLITHIHHQPAWFTSNATIAVLSVLSLLELFAQKNSDARRLLAEFDSVAKSIMAALTLLGVMNATDSKFVAQTLHQAGLLDGFPVLLSAAGVFVVSHVRRGALIALHDIDPDDALRLQRLISWAEDAWVLGGLLLFVLYPLVMLFLIGMAIGMLVLTRKYLQSVEEHSKIPCARCQSPIYPSAMACPKCHQVVACPHEVGILGQSRPYPCANPVTHPYRLIEKRRCPVCATHLRRRSPHQLCAACGHHLFADDGEIGAYLSYINRRLPTTLAICTLVSAVPILGMIIGTIYYRLELINPFGVYLPMGRRFLLRWGLRLAFFVLVLLQIVPIAGVLAVPVMALLSYAAYRSSFVSLSSLPETEPPETLAPPLAPPRTA